jgi:hypothetical protein
MLRVSASLSRSSQPETQLDSRSFVKLFKDSQLMDKKLTTTDLDIIFSKASISGPCINADQLAWRMSTDSC